MRRVILLLSLVVVVMLGIARLPGSPAAVAQEATPAAEGMEMGGLTFQPLGFAPGVPLPGTVDLEVARAGFAPGAGFPFDASDPQGALVIMESGTLTVRVEEQAWYISRGAALEQAMATDAAAPDMSGVLEEVAMGEEATLEAGDVAHIPGNLTGEVRNAGSEPASALLVLIGPSTTTGEESAEATPSS